MTSGSERLRGTAYALLFLSAGAFVLGVVSGLTQVLDDDSTFSYPTSELTEFLSAGAGMYTVAAILFGTRAILIGLIGVVEELAAEE